MKKRGQMDQIFVYIFLAVVAGLILREILKGRIPRTNKNTLIDGGSYNSAKVSKRFFFAETPP